MKILDSNLGTDQNVVRLGHEVASLACSLQLQERYASREMRKRAVFGAKIAHEIDYGEAWGHNAATEPSRYLRASSTKAFALTKSPHTGGKAKLTREAMAWVVQMPFITVSGWWTGVPNSFSASSSACEEKRVQEWENEEVRAKASPTGPLRRCSPRRTRYCLHSGW